MIAYHDYIKKIADDICSRMTGKDFDDNLDDYLADIKRLFIERFRKDPALKKQNPEMAWNVIQQTVRNDVEKTLRNKFGIIMQTIGVRAH